MKKHIAGITIASCWVTYLTAYLCRVNFSSAMDTLRAERGFTTEQLGVVGAVFYAVYACGQLVNGYLGDRVRANRFLLAALCGTALCNLGVSVASGFPAVLLLWGVNGCFQSMFWSTIIRVLAQGTPLARRSAVSSVISMAMPAAYLVSWSLLGQRLSGCAARWYFLIPALCAGAMAAVWVALSFRLFRGGEALPQKSKANLGQTVRFLREEKLLALVLVCVLHGLIKEGVTYWTPLLVSGFPDAAKWSPNALVAILPLANFAGIFASRVLLGKTCASPLKVLLLLFAAIAVLSAGLLAVSGTLAVIGAMALISGVAYANNTVLMSFLPMQYTSRNMVASIIGVFDFASYLGAALSTFVLGRLLGQAGFSPVPGIWLGAALAAGGIVAALAVCVKKKKTARPSVL